MNWLTCYLLYRKDYDSWVFLDDSIGLLKQIEADIEYCTDEAKNWSSDTEMGSEYHQDAAILASDLEKIKAWLPTAEHKDTISVGLCEVTAFELPLRFRDHYLDIAPDWTGWD